MIIFIPYKIMTDITQMKWKFIYLCLMD